MDGDQELRDILKELSNAISRSLSSPEALGRLEKLQQKGYQLYLVLEPIVGGMRKHGSSPVMPIQIFPEGAATRKGRSFELSEDDKDFLRTLKIRVD